ncbi:hypothetical protein [Streptococcus suis]|uniref:hypothetical protein n=1 Tax=Streptococcus suis TaxID=1307 RepID=UPI0009438384|nr:hypothetical protein [Streptococcus suis]HEL1594617.1 hypothetical protein [Streptococcus suis]HEL1704607.1 hypothetical protein [Streptococcus suis]
MRKWLNQWLKWFVEPDNKRLLPSSVERLEEENAMLLTMATQLSQERMMYRRDNQRLSDEIARLRRILEG